LRAYIHQYRTAGRTTGFVPTMGALHSGHISLIQQSTSDNDLTVCSIFVNPTQFNNADDLARYPRTIEEDILKLEAAGCDVLFHPDPAEMYPEGLKAEAYNWGPVTHSLEGAFRPGHFDGVIAIVSKLFRIVEPDRAYFGQKDFQQCAVIARMILEFGLEVDLRVEPTLREDDGLALSSRNARLTPAERTDALLISKALRHIRQYRNEKPAARLVKEAEDLMLSSNLMKPEYIAIVDRDTLEPVKDASGRSNSVALIASWCGNVRLIDNMLLDDYT
jgi:pantoate--beta-alanine ligase